MSYGWGKKSRENSSEALQASLLGATDLLEQAKLLFQKTSEHELVGKISVAISSIETLLQNQARK